MDFVVRVLISIFGRSTDEATHIMLDVHNSGAGIAGTYPRDVAETKIAAVAEDAQSSGQPLRLSAEPE